MTLQDKLLLFQQCLENQDYEFLVYLKQNSQIISFGLELCNDSLDIEIYFQKLKKAYYIDCNFENVVPKISGESIEFQKFTECCKIYIYYKLKQQYSIDQILEELKETYEKILIK